MGLKFSPVLLTALSLAAIINLGLTWHPGNGNISVISKNFSAPQAYAMPEKETPKKVPEQKSKRIQPVKPDLQTTVKEQSAGTALVGTAEASIFSGNPGDDLSREEIEALRGLRGIKKKLDARAKALDDRQQSIEKAEASIARRVGELEGLLAKIKDRLQQEKGIKSKKIKRLTAVYASMKPQKSAQVLSRMQLPIVVKMFSRMDEKKVGKILSFLSPDKAVKITRALTMKISSLGQ